MEEELYFVDRQEDSEEHCWPPSQVAGKQSLNPCSFPSAVKVFVIHSGLLTPHWVVHVNKKAGDWWALRQFLNLRRGEGPRWVLVAPERPTV